MGELIDMSDFDRTLLNQETTVEVPFSYTRPPMDQFQDAQALSIKENGAAVTLISPAGEIITTVFPHTSLDTLYDNWIEGKMRRSLAKAVGRLTLLTDNHPIASSENMRPPLRIVRS